MMVQKTFRKEERLCSKKSISDLFHNGSSFVLYPYRVVFLGNPRQTADQTLSVKVLFSVSKRKFPKAVDRNLIKRRMREAYRLQKGEFVSGISSIAANSCDIDRPEHRGQNLDLAIQYIAGESKDFLLLYNKMAEVLSKLQKEYAEVCLGENH